MAISAGPSRAADFPSEGTQLVRRACLEVASRLQDFMDLVCIVGGLVPTLLIDQSGLPDSILPHVGTRDLDLALSLAILDEHRYEAIATRMLEAGFTQDQNERGRLTSQRWRSASGALVDFLIAPSAPSDQPGRLRNLTGDLAAFITPGLHLAFADRQRVRVHGETLTGGTTDREIQVCGPGAFVALKALAFRNRGQEKDAYDLWYVMEHRHDAAARLKRIADDQDAQMAIAFLRADFADMDCIGPRRVAEFLHGRRDDDLQADVCGRVRSLLAVLDA